MNNDLTFYLKMHTDDEFREKKLMSFKKQIKGFPMECIENLVTNIVIGTERRYI